MDRRHARVHAEAGHRVEGGGRGVGSAGLASPGEATTIRFEHGLAVPTDGPFAETKESLAGYWIVDVTKERAIDIASRVLEFIEYPMEVRALMNE